MELKKIYPFFISIIACVLFGWGVIYISLSGKADEIVESSVKERALKAQVALSKSLFKEIKSKHSNNKKEQSDQALLTESEYRLKYEKLIEQLSLSQNEIAKKIDLIELEHQNLINLARQSGIKISAVESLSPSMAFYLSSYLDIDIERLSDDDLNKIKMSSEHWNYIRTFLNSNDFKILLSKNRVDQHLINPERLKLTYQSNDNIREKNRLNQLSR